MAHKECDGSTYTWSLYYAGLFVTCDTFRITY